MSKTNREAKIRKSLDQMVRNGDFNFALEGPKGKIRRSSGSGGPKPIDPPEQRIREWRERALDPDVAEGLRTLTDYLIGSGFTVQPRNIPGTEEQLDDDAIAEVKKLLESPGNETHFYRWVHAALRDGVAYMEINWDENERFAPRILPPERIKLKRDEYDRVVGYIIDSEGEDEQELGKYDVAHLGFWREPGADHYQSIVEVIETQSEMLEDMEIDMARFVATKAYPPILWKLGSEETGEWNDSEIDGWLDQVSQIEPDSMLAGPHDVEAEAVGVTDTTATSGAMDLSGTFDHLQKRLATGMGLPYFLNNGGDASRTDSVAMMPKFDRRIQSLRQMIRAAVEDQILRSLYYHPNPEEHEGEMVPRFEFGEHSSEEERLEVQTALKLWRNGFLTRKAVAQRIGIDPEVEMPTVEEVQAETVPLLLALGSEEGGPGDPAGGRPAEDDAGERTATTRQNPEKAGGDDKRTRSSIEDEGAL